MQHPKELIKGSKGLEMRSKCSGGENSNFKKTQETKQGIIEEEEYSFAEGTSILK